MLFCFICFQDLLANDDIKLDWLFRMSFANDIAKVMSLTFFYWRAIITQLVEHCTSNPGDKVKCCNRAVFVIS